MKYLKKDIYIAFGKAFFATSFGFSEKDSSALIKLLGKDIFDSLDLRELKKIGISADPNTLLTAEAFYMLGKNYCELLDGNNITEKDISDELCDEIGTKLFNVSRFAVFPNIETAIPLGQLKLSKQEEKENTSLGKGLQRQDELRPLGTTRKKINTILIKHFEKEREDFLLFKSADRHYPNSIVGMVKESLLTDPNTIIRKTFALIRTTGLFIIASEFYCSSSPTFQNMKGYGVFMQEWNKINEQVSVLGKQRKVAHGLSFVQENIFQQLGKKMIEMANTLREFLIGCYLSFFKKDDSLTKHEQKIIIDQLNSALGEEFSEKYGVPRWKFTGNSVLLENIRLLNTESGSAYAEKFEKVGVSSTFNVLCNKERDFFQLEILDVRTILAKEVEQFLKKIGAPIQYKSFKP